ncbi:MAG TPA: hypothetical protein VLH13_04830, partial [Methanomassiliicoccales archaeon]|nr:hypothetical protein [Methanomassiliicoccales archaeon]
DSAWRFVLFLVLISIFALVIILKLMPWQPTYEDYIEEQDIPDLLPEVVVERAVEGRTIDQMGMYQELRASFASRVRSRRGIDDEVWERMMFDKTMLGPLIGDEELLRLLMERTNGREDDASSLFVYGDGFISRFEFLLRKVEGWR